MKRILLFAIVCGTAFAASRAETTTYVDGNVTGVSPNTGGTLLFADDKTMIFRTGLATVNVAYATISRSELGATREISHDVAFYKVWAKHKKTETQFLIVDFKNEEGEARTMTLELAQASASGVLAAIQDHTGPNHEPVLAGAKSDSSARQAAITKGPVNNPKDAGAVASPATKVGSDWWGDDIWKTTRNASTWSRPTGTTAPEE